MTFFHLKVSARRICSPASGATRPPTAAASARTASTLRTARKTARSKCSAWPCALPVTPGRVGAGREVRRRKVKFPLGFQPNSARVRPMLRSNVGPPEAELRLLALTVAPLLRRKLASEFTTARTPVVLTLNRSLPGYITRPKRQTVTRATRPSPANGATAQPAERPACSSW